MKFSILSVSIGGFTFRLYSLVIDHSNSVYHSKPATLRTRSLSMHDWDPSMVKHYDDSRTARAG
jgi:hypothetical protein